LKEKNKKQAQKKAVKLVGQETNKTGATKEPHGN
jgi:hypothetical protein